MWSVSALELEYTQVHILMFGKVWAALRRREMIRQNERILLREQGNDVAQAGGLLQR